MREGAIQRESSFKNFNWILLSAAIGSAVTFYFDPDVGRRRRALVRDKFVELGHATGWYLNQQLRNLTNHAQGWVARGSRLFEPAEIPDDDTLVRRVRAQMGRKVRHPHSVHVVAHEGAITLTGLILADEVEPLFNSVRGVRGVRRVINELEVHRSGERVSGLQGEGKSYLKGDNPK